MARFSKLRKLLIAFALCGMPVISMADFPQHHHYQQHNRVSNGTIAADHTDPNLVNPWGIAFGVTNPVWVANQGSGTSTIYNGFGVQAPLIVTIPSAPSVGGLGKPTGIVFNNTPNFAITSNGVTANAAFIFATEDGTISAWAPIPNLTKAIIAVDNSATGAVYKGLARGANGKAAFLYAANFSAGKVDVFDGTFKPVTTAGAFIDPFLPAGYAPFNVQNLRGNIYVTYAKQDATKRDVVKGEGLGIVNVFDADGKFIRRVATGGPLNAPWGLVITPANFGKFSNELLVGNFGDGTINAYDLDSDLFRGQLHGEGCKPITIDGLWALAFGNGFNNQPTDVLFFTAGPDNEKHGIYGTLEPIDQ